MGTKDNPAAFDCYDKADPDEPMFVLLARDPLAPFLVSIWAKLRVGDGEAANAVFIRMLNTLGLQYAISPDIEKADEATKCFMEMFKWKNTHG